MNNTVPNTLELNAEDLVSVTGGDDHFEERFGAMFGLALVGGMTGGAGFVVAAFVVGGSLLIY